MSQCYEVFLSHAETDSEAAHRFKEWLSSLLTTHVFASSIAPGQDFRDAILTALDQCKVAVVLITKNSIKREWVHYESGVVRGLKKRLIPLCIGDVRRSELPSTLANLQACEYGDKASRQNMVATIADLLGTERARVVEISEKIKTTAPTLRSGPPDESNEPDSPAPLSALLSSCGLAHAFRIPSQDPDREIRVKRLVQAELELKQPQFRLAASSGYSYLHPQGPVWKTGLGAALEKGRAKFSVVLQSPFSVFAITRALVNGVDHDQWADRGMAPQLVRLLKECKNVRIMVTGHSVNCSLFFTSKAVFYDPYLWSRPGKVGRSENNFWVFEFQKSISPECDCYGLLKKHFDFLASESVPLSEILGDQGDLKHYRDLQDKFSSRLCEAREKGKHDFAISI
jgi:hypothetical protein